MTGKRNLFLGLLIGLVLGGALPAFLSFHGWTSAQDSRQVLLRQGWNQLVWTVDNQPAAYAFDGIVDDLAIVYGWRNDSQTFTRYITGRGDVSTMSMLERDSGYWLLLKRDVFLTMPASAGACPEPTACPSPPPSDDCGECASALLSCVSALDECDESFWGMSDLFDECQEDYSEMSDFLDQCNEDYWECDANFWEMSGLLDQCHADVTFWQGRARYWESEASFWQYDMCYGGLCCDYCY